MSNKLATKLGGTAADLSASGGTGKFLKQLTVGGPFSVANILTSELPVAPFSVTPLLSGSGTYTRKLAFTITSGSATVGATYTNNGNTFTVFATVASATLIYMNGASDPAASGTLTKASGTGDSTLTFSQFNVPNKLLVTAVGGGGGGGGGGTSGTATSGSAGGNTTFGTSLIVANGGAGGITGPAAGGTASLGTALGIALQGSSGGGYCALNTQYCCGGIGGSGVYGNGAGIGQANGVGTAAITNSGAGGGGGGTTNVAGLHYGMGGGGGGGVCYATILSPSTTYSYAVGASGAAGAAGTDGYIGGAGASGGIWVTEIY